MRLASAPGCDSWRLLWGHQRREGWWHDPNPKPGGERTPQSMVLGAASGSRAGSSAWLLPAALGAAGALGIPRGITRAHATHTSAGTREGPWHGTHTAPGPGAPGRARTPGPTHTLSLPAGRRGQGCLHGHGSTTAGRAGWRRGQDGDGVRMEMGCQRSPCAWRGDADTGCMVVPTPLRPSPGTAGGPSPELTIGLVGWNGVGWGHGAVSPPPYRQAFSLPASPRRAGAAEEVLSPP